MKDLVAFASFALILPSALLYTMLSLELGSPNPLAWEALLEDRTAASQRVGIERCSAICLGRGEEFVAVVRENLPGFVPRSQRQCICTSGPPLPF